MRPLGERYPQDVVEFSRHHGLADKLGLAVELVNQAFPEAQGVTVGLEHDPESKDRWMIVDAHVSGPVKEVRLRHRECARRLVELLPWPTSTLLRTTYTLV